MTVLPNLTFRQLITFREVMRTNSITAASRALGRTQPAVSSVIANLEEQLNLPLFVRDRGALTPTPEAYYFLEEASDVLDRLERTARTMGEFSNLDRGGIRIACYPAGASNLLPKLLAEFLQGRPDVRADLIVRASQAVEDLIASQEFDVGLAKLPEARGSIEVEPFELKCRVAVPEDDPLAAKRKISMSDLDGHPMAALYDEHEITINTQEAFQKHRAQFNRRFTMHTFLPTIELVKAGLCAAIVDGLTASTTSAPGVVFKKLEPEITHTIALLRPAHRPLSVLAKEFETRLRQQLKSIVRT